MKAVRKKALSLRLQGHSYNEINTKLGVPKSTLSGWLSDVTLSKKAKDRIQERVRRGVLESLVKRNKNQTVLAQERALATQKQAKAIIPSLSRRELLLVGTALYWGEGYKKLRYINGKERTHHTLGFTNADHDMIAVYIKFLKEVLHIPIEEIKVGIRLFKHMDEEKALNHWSQVTGLPKKRFYKTTYSVSTSSKGKRPHNRLPHGTIYVTVCDTQKFHHMVGLIDGLKEQLLKNK